MNLTPEEVNKLLDTPEGRMKIAELMVEPLQKALGFSPWQIERIDTDRKRKAKKEKK